MNDRSSKSHVYSSKSAYRLFLRVYSKMEMSISALGHKRTLKCVTSMSESGRSSVPVGCPLYRRKRDIGERDPRVSFVP